jgi:hypothetical protein
MPGFENAVLVAENVNFDHAAANPHNGIVTANGQLLIGAASAPFIRANTLIQGSGISIVNGPGTIMLSVSGATVGQTITGDDALALSPTAGNWNILGQQAGTIPVMETDGTAPSTLRIEDRTLTTRFVVDPSATIGLRGTFQTIGAAITAAGAGPADIFIRTGTYTENLTLPANINLTGFTCDPFTPTVSIVGKITCTDAGARTISNIRLTSNSDNILAVTGSAATIVALVNCFLNMSGATAISYTSSSGSSGILFKDCTGLVTGNIATFIATGAGGIEWDNCQMDAISWTGAVSSTSACPVSYNRSVAKIALATTLTGMYNLNYSVINAAAGGNITALTTAGTGATVVTRSHFTSGSAVAISIGSGTTVSAIGASVDSTNTATGIIAGAGTLTYDYVGSNHATGVLTPTTLTAQRFFTGNVHGRTLNFSTNASGTAVSQMNLSDSGGQYRGFNSNTAPPAGYIGQEIRGALVKGSATALSTGTPKTVTSITLTPGNWDISFVCGFSGGAITGTAFAAGIATATNSITGWVDGDNDAGTPTAPTAESDVTVSIPSFRVSIASNTDYFLTAIAVYTVGAVTAYGRIKGVRVG